ncbi:hypothetical protein LWI29_026899 [Acer saccharum]|uniref:Uncharacterized protein n=1 Tax=Acer saccharum TaxID=4024 RepID=A0AA39REE8_ACESA|nr:hypothetical protein LWI29_026899 [Acer saccharum]
MSWNVVSWNVMVRSWNVMVRSWNVMECNGTVMECHVIFESGRIMESHFMSWRIKESHSMSWNVVSWNSCVRESRFVIRKRIRNRRSDAQDMGQRTEGARERCANHVWPLGQPVWEAVGPTRPPRGADVAPRDLLGNSLIFPPFKQTSFPPHLCNF